jgi:hypothetical protein
LEGKPSFFNDSLRDNLGIDSAIFLEKMAARIAILRIRSIPSRSTTFSARQFDYSLAPHKASQLLFSRPSLNLAPDCSSGITGYKFRGALKLQSPWNGDSSSETLKEKEQVEIE